jgi:hypothetical protein
MNQLITEIKYIFTDIIFFDPEYLWICIDMKNGSLADLTKLKKANKDIWSDDELVNLCLQVVIFC